MSVCLIVGSKRKIPNAKAFVTVAVRARVTIDISSIGMMDFMVVVDHRRGDWVFLGGRARSKEGIYTKENKLLYT